MVLQMSRKCQNRIEDGHRALVTRLEHVSVQLEGTSKREGSCEPTFMAPVNAHNS